MVMIDRLFTNKTQVFCEGCLLSACCVTLHLVKTFVTDPNGLKARKVHTLVYFRYCITGIPRLLYKKRVVRCSDAYLNLKKKFPAHAFGHYFCIY